MPLYFETPSLMLVYCKYAHLMHKFYAPNNHMNYWNFIPEL